MAVVLMVGSGLMAQSFRELTQVQTGFQDGEEVLTFRVNLPEGVFPGTLDVLAFHEDVIRQLGQIPGVESVTGSNSLPMDGSDSNQSIHIEDFPTPESDTPPLVRLKWVAGEYFETLRNPILHGRGITWADTNERARVVVVNEAYAERFWGDAELAIGRRVQYCCGDWHEIVGVVANPHDNGVDRAAANVVYWPLAVEGFWGRNPWVPRWFAYAVRTNRSDPMALVDDAREVVRQISPSVPLFSVRTLDDIAAVSMLRTTYTLTLLGGATLVAMLLAFIGIYGVISYSMSQRRREIGIRIALGAGLPEVRLLVLRSGFVMIGLGTVVGLAAAAGLSRFMESLLFGVAPFDPGTYGAVPLLLFVVAGLACYLPARRATRVDPADALRME